VNTLCDLRTVLRDTLGVLHQQGTVFEIRIPKVRFRKQTASGYFDDPNAAATAALAFDGNAPALYVTINPVAPALLARAANRMQDYAEHTTADHDIVRRHWLPLDIDPVRPSGISSTDAEHNAAHALAQQIRDELRQDGWPDPVYGDSGNGASLLYAIDLPNTPDVTDLIKRTLAGLAQRFNTDLVQVDTSVFNAARIMKLYGTIVKKGDNTPDRPHRQ
jgi:hypothetical protein